MLPFNFLNSIHHILCRIAVQNRQKCRSRLTKAELCTLHLFICWYVERSLFTLRLFFPVGLNEKLQ